MTASALKLKGVKISGVGVYKWTKKQVGSMESCAGKIRPKSEAFGGRLSLNLDPRHRSG